MARYVMIDNQSGLIFGDTAVMARVCRGQRYSQSGPRHQWVRSSGTVVQVDILPAHVVVRLKGRRHSLCEMAWPNGALRRLMASVYETLIYVSQEPTWGPLDTADGPA